MRAPTPRFRACRPGTLAGRYLRRFWHPVYRSADLVAGRPVRLEVLSEHFTLYRGESGAVFLLVDRCPHRQTSLVHGWVEGDRIRCFYHGWVFDGAGQCIEQPAEKASFAAKVKVCSYPVEEYLGLIFAYLGDGAPPPFPRYPEIEEARPTSPSTATSCRAAISSASRTISTKPMSISSIASRPNPTGSTRSRDRGARDRVRHPPRGPAQRRAASTSRAPPISCGRTSISSTCRPRPTSPIGRCRSLGACRRTMRA